MLSEILLETLSFLDRSSLEACQLVNRSYLTLITKSNAALALRPMDVFAVICADYVEAAGGVVRFLRYASSENIEEAVNLWNGTDWDQLQAVAEETVARTRNMCIDSIDIFCVSCASSLIALWRDTFNDLTPCRAVELSMASSCSLNSDADLHQLLQPFAYSKLGVVRYDVVLYGTTWDEEESAKFDAFWSAWDRPTAQFITFHLNDMDECSHFLEQLLREPGQGDRHFTVESDDSSEVLQILESYMQKFEYGGSELNFPVSLAFYRDDFTHNTVHKLRLRPLQTLEKPPMRDVHAPKVLWPDCSESRCDVYEILNFARRRTMRAFFWVTTRPADYSTGGEELYVHCHWFNVMPF